MMWSKYLICKTSEVKYYLKGIQCKRYKLRKHPTTTQLNFKVFSYQRTLVQYKTCNQYHYVPNRVRVHTEKDSINKLKLERTPFSDLSTEDLGIYYR